jgi:hypothetical protein
MTLWLGHVIAYLLQALFHKMKVAVLIPDDVTEFI